MVRRNGEDEWRGGLVKMHGEDNDTLLRSTVRMDVTVNGEDE